MMIQPVPMLRFAATLVAVVCLASSAGAAPASADELLIELTAPAPIQVVGSGSVSMRDGRMVVPLPDGATVFVDGVAAESNAFSVSPGSTVVLRQGDDVLFSIEVGAARSDSQTGSDRTNAQAFGSAGGGFRSSVGFSSAGDRHGRAVASASDGRGRVMIGVVTREPDGALAAQLGLDPDTTLIVNDVSDGLPAARAGLQVHDVIVAVDGEQVVTTDSLRGAIRSHGPGEPVRLTILRQGRRIDLEVPVAAAANDVIDSASGGVSFVTTRSLPGAPDRVRDDLMHFNELKARLDAGLTDLHAGTRELAEVYANLEQQQDGLGSVERRLVESLAALDRAQAESDEALSTGEAAAAARAGQRAAETAQVIETLRQQLAMRRDQAQSAAVALEQARLMQTDREAALADVSAVSRALEQQLAERRGIEFLLDDGQDGGQALLLPSARALLRSAEQQLRDQQLAEQLAGGAGVAERLGQLESRMGRLEELLTDWMARHEQGVR